MSKFNSPAPTTRTKNHENAPAYTMPLPLELYSTVVTASLSDKFYEGSQETLKRIRDLVAKNDPKFVAQLAVYAREQMYLRSIPLVLTVELARIHNGDDLIARLVNRVVQRADEITELLAYYAQANERTDTKKLGKLSKQLQKGLSMAFNRFDAYQFAKYNRDGAVKLRDALFLVHPKAKDAEQQAIFDKIAAGTLETPDTWEVELSASTDKKASWERLISENRLGYMALLRNLRNILQAQVNPDLISAVAKRLADPEQVRKSKQFPFRFLSAYRELKEVASGYTPLVMDALEEAIKVSIENLPGFDINVALTIACDVSGSMQRPISERSKVQNYDIGLVLGMLLHQKSQNVETGIFGNTWKIIQLPKNNILSNADELHRREGEVGYSTNGFLVLKDLIDRKEVKDKIMMFTDCQMWNSYGGNDQMNNLWAQYKQIAPNAKLYLFDLAGYGTTPVSIQGNGAYLIAGWSDKVFGMLEAYEKGSSAVAEIETITV